MMNANALVALVGAVYVVTAVWYGMEGKQGFAMMFAGYALANVGVILAAKGI